MLQDTFGIVSVTIRSVVVIGGTRGTAEVFIFRVSTMGDGAFATHHSLAFQTLSFGELTALDTDSLCFPEWRRSE